jgi:hypothetical protein
MLTRWAVVCSLIGTGTLILLGHTDRAVAADPVAMTLAEMISIRSAVLNPRWTPENRPLMDGSKPAISESGRDR